MIERQIHSSREKKPFGAISVDVDTLFSLFADYDSKRELVYDRALPRYLDLFKRHSIKVTLFVVGRDLERSAQARNLIQQAASAGHEIANHTMNHPQGLGWQSMDQQWLEISRAEEIISQISGQKVNGFRAPGWNACPRTFGLLVRRGYLYDSSLFPSSLNMLMKLAHWWSSRCVQDRFGRRTLGPLGAMAGPNRPYLLACGADDSKRLVEIPISTTPSLRLPVFGTFNLVTGRPLLAASLRAMARRRLPLNYELHAVEMLDPDRDGLHSIKSRIKGEYIPPSISMDLDRKFAFFNWALGEMKKRWRLITLNNLAKETFHDSAIAPGA